MDIATGFSTASTTRSRRRRYRILVRSVAIALIIAAAAFGGWSYMTRPLSLAATRATRGSVADVVYATGFVEPQRPVDVSSRVTAPVVAVLADEGDHVRRGQALVRLDAEDQRHTINQLAADRIKAEQDEIRAVTLFRDGWMAKAARDAAVAAANAARAAEASGRAKLDQYTIRAGVTGVVLRRDVEPGDLATAAKTLFRIGDSKQLRVTATVDERDIPLVRNGAAALMSTEAYPGEIVRGTVYEITPAGDPEQRAFRVRIRPDRPLPVGLTLEVNLLVTQRSHALLVPPGAIRGKWVWIAHNGRAEAVPVESGIRATDRTEVRSGLSDGACVIKDPPDKLKPGDRVSLKGC